MGHFTSQEIASLLKLSKRGVNKRASREQWQSQPRQARGGGREWLVSSMPQSTQLAIRNAQEAEAIEAAQAVEVEQANSLPAMKRAAALSVIPKELDPKRLDKAMFRADLVRAYVFYQERYGFTVAAKTAFISAYEGGAYPYIYDALGKTSWQSLERWRNKLSSSSTATALADLRGIHRRGISLLTDEHRNIILGQYLHYNDPKIAQCVRRIHERCRAQGLDIPSESTVRRWVEQFNSTCYGEMMFFKKGKKAWNDACSISVMRDWSLIEVGDVVIADGHTLNFETINPATGNAKRMNLLLFFDGRSNMPLGWEITASENTQCISAAFRRTCIMLGKMPRVVYIDNGAAFRAKFFKGSKDLEQSGIFGLYESLGVQVVHAWAYHGQSKPIERFFGTMLDMEIATPSYVGNSIANKPARLHRNEKVHQRLHERVGGRPLTLEETHMAIASWFDAYSNRPSRAKHLKGGTPYAIFSDGCGTGLTGEQLDRMDVLMMHQSIRTITKDGFRLNGRLYWDEALANRRHEILVRYDDYYDPYRVRVYDVQGRHICDALDRKQHKIAYGVHPMASILGTEEQKLHLVESLELKKTMEKQARAPVKAMLEAVVLPELEAQNARFALSTEAKTPENCEKMALDTKALSDSERQAFFDEVEELANATPSYTPSAQKIFRDRQARYDYLFNLKYQDGVELIFADEAWMQDYEQSDEFAKYHQEYYAQMREILCINY